MQAAYEASRRSLVEDEIKRWEQVLAAAQPPPPPPPPGAPLTWWQHLVQEQEAEENEELAHVEPLPVEENWVWTSGIWAPPSPPLSGEYFVD